MIRAVISTLFISSLIAQGVEISEFPAKLKEQDYSIDRIIKGHGGWTFYLDLDSRIVSSQSSKGIFYFTGGFGNDYDSFIDPIGFKVSNLDLYIFDRSENKVFRFDYSLNLINSLDLSSKFNRSNLVIDDMAVDSWGYFYLFSKNNNVIMRGNMSGIEPLIFIDLNQHIIERDCGENIEINSNGDIALFYPCSSQLLIFNRLGRLKYKLNTSISNPQMITNHNNSWVIINNEGLIESFNQSSSKLYSIPLVNNEKLIDITASNVKMLFLTNQRIIELYLD